MAEIDKKYERLNSLYSIMTEKGEVVQYKFNSVQEELYQGLHSNNIVLKARQTGITTFWCLFGLDTAIHVPNIRVGIIAHIKEDAEKFFNDKVKFAWDRLDPAYKQRLGISNVETNTVREIRFSNNSSIRVGTSMRSGTLQVLHISEFGKVCARFPEKAREIVTGSLNTVHEGAIVSIESTAEGRDGYFYDYCQEAEKQSKSKLPLTRMDYKFFFFPWHRDPKNVLSEDVVITARLDKYFASLQSRYKIKLSQEQKNWYAKKEATQGDDMLREFPSTPDEAFHVSVEGAYFKRQFERIYKDGRITALQYDDGLPVYTAWDIGMSDSTVIWFFQKHGDFYRFFDYYANEGEGLPHYINVLRARKYKYNKHYGPHDLAVREWTGDGKSRKQIALEKGLRFTAVKSIFKADQIELARELLNNSIFDESKCAEGIKALENYRKEWDETKGCWKEKPLHNWASHPADAFMIAAMARIPDYHLQARQQRAPLPAREAAY